MNAARYGATDTHAMPIEVVDWTDDLEVRATELRDSFVAYLAENHPESAITPQAEWTPTVT